MNTSIIKTGMVLAVILLMALPVRAELTQERVDSMFVIASSGAMKYRDIVEPTKDSMAAYGTEMVPYLIEKLNTIDARERMTLEGIFRKIGIDAVPQLNEALVQAEDSLQISRIALMLYYLPEASSVEPLLPITTHTYYWARYQAVRALGKIGDERGRAAVVAALQDENELVRTIAAVSAGRMIADASLFDVLVPVLDDSYYGVRYAAFESLKGLDCAVKSEHIRKYAIAAESAMTLKFLYKVMIEDTCLYTGGGFYMPEGIEVDGMLQAYREFVFYKDNPANSPMHDPRSSSLTRDVYFFFHVESELEKRLDEKATTTDSR